jgi:hypothetical protein
MPRDPKMSLHLMIDEFCAELQSKIGKFPRRAKITLVAAQSDKNLPCFQALA